MDHTLSSKGGEDLTHSYLSLTLLGFTALLSGAAFGTEKIKEGPKTPVWRAHVPGCMWFSGKGLLGSVRGITVYLTVRGL